MNRFFVQTIFIISFVSVWCWDAKPCEDHDELLEIYFGPGQTCEAFAEYGLCTRVLVGVYRSVSEICRLSCECGTVSSDTSYVPYTTGEVKEATHEPQSSEEASPQVSSSSPTTNPSRSSISTSPSEIASSLLPTTLLPKQPTVGDVFKSTEKVSSDGVVKASDMTHLPQDDSAQSQEQFCASISVPTEGCFIYEAAALYSDSSCTIPQEGPRWFGNRGTFKKPIGSCTSNLANQRVIFECQADGTILESIYYHFDGSGSYDCSGEPLFTLTFGKGCNHFGGGNYAHFAWDGYCNGNGVSGDTSYVPYTTEEVKEATHEPQSSGEASATHLPNDDTSISPTINPSRSSISTSPSESASSLSPTTLPSKQPTVGDVFKSTEKASSSPSESASSLSPTTLPSKQPTVGDVFKFTEKALKDIITLEVEVRGVNSANKDEVCAAFAKSFSGKVISCTFIHFARRVLYPHSLSMQIAVPNAFYAKEQFDNQSFMKLLELPEGVTLNSVYYHLESSKSSDEESFTFTLAMWIAICVCCCCIVYVSCQQYYKNREKYDHCYDEENSYGVRRNSLDSRWKKEHQNIW